MSSSLALAAGTVATVVFAASTLPMLGKALRTKDLASYSRGNLVLANVGNLVYSLYVFHLPAGPIWLLHTFYAATSALMLFWSLRYRRPDTAPRSTPCAATPIPSPAGTSTPVPSPPATPSPWATSTSRP
jgi:uncharacterized protein with PQ loop repeat